MVVFYSSVERQSRSSEETAFVKLYCGVYVFRIFCSFVSFSGEIISPFCIICQNFFVRTIDEKRYNQKRVGEDPT